LLVNVSVAFYGFHRFFGNMRYEYSISIKVYLSSLFTFSFREAFNVTSGMDAQQFRAIISSQRLIFGS